MTTVYIWSRDRYSRKDNIRRGERDGHRPSPKGNHRWRGLRTVVLEHLPNHCPIHFQLAALFGMIPEKIPPEGVNSKILNRGRVGWVKKIYQRLRPKNRTPSCASEMVRCVDLYALTKSSHSVNCECLKITRIILVCVAELCHVLLRSGPQIWIWNVSVRLPSLRPPLLDRS